MIGGVYQRKLKDRVHDVLRRCSNSIEHKSSNKTVERDKKLKSMKKTCATSIVLDLVGSDTDNQCPLPFLTEIILDSRALHAHVNGSQGDARMGNTGARIRKGT